MKNILLFLNATVIGICLAGIWFDNFYFIPGVWAVLNMFSIRFVYSVLENKTCK